MTNSSYWAYLACLAAVTGSMSACAAGPGLLTPAPLRTQNQSSAAVQGQEGSNATAEPAAGALGPKSRQIILCSTEGDKVASQVARHLLTQARQRLQLQEVFSDADVQQAEPVLGQFLALKLGNPLSLCMHATTTGLARLDDRFKDAAAASLMGLLKINGKEPQIVLPEWLTGYLSRRMVTAETLPNFLDSLGVPSALAVELKSHLNKDQAPAPISIDNLDRIVQLAAIVRQHLHDEEVAKEGKPPASFLRQVEALRKAKADAAKAKETTDKDTVQSTDQDKDPGHGIILVVDRAPLPAGPAQ
ncbi:MAG: hypothetical protein H7338_07450 [Candidatus Sericytochromatia bacterium]|nr:hypothetical protein [Candidatus Sericytochromatia bacterium]